jgi:hypothetical protein
MKIDRLNNIIFSKMDFSSFKIRNHPLFTAMRGDNFNVQEFLSRFWVFQCTIANWNNMLTLLLIREENHETRKILGNNLMDELGHGDPTQFHTFTFAIFIGTFLDDSTLRREIHDRIDFPNLLNFEKKLTYLHETDPDYCYAFLGKIEKMYVKVSQEICILAEKMGCSMNEVPHFSNHTALDILHGNEFYRIPYSSKILHKKAKHDARTMFYHVFDDFMPIKTSS